MKFNTCKIEDAMRHFLLFVLFFALLAALLAPAPCRAQPGTAGVVYQVQPPTPVIYPLTNPPSAWLTNGVIPTNCIAITNGYLNLSSNCTYVVQSQPFKLWPGRGFALNASFVNTNATASTLTFNLRFATVHPAPWGGSTLVTNWSTTPAMAIGCAGNGLTVVNFSTNVTANVADNWQLGQVYSIGVSTAATATLFDPTNFFAGVFPSTVIRPQ